mgnify:CR=1 FL=1
MWWSQMPSSTRYAFQKRLDLCVPKKGWFIVLHNILDRSDVTSRTRFARQNLPGYAQVMWKTNEHSQHIRKSSPSTTATVSAIRGKNHGCGPTSKTERARVFRDCRVLKRLYGHDVAAGEREMRDETRQNTHNDTSEGIRLLRFVKSVVEAVIWLASNLLSWKERGAFEHGRCKVINHDWSPIFIRPTKPLLRWHNHSQLWLLSVGNRHWGERLRWKGEGRERWQWQGMRLVAKG